MKLLLIWFAFLMGCAHSPDWNMTDQTNSPHYRLEKNTVTRLDAHSMFWRTITIGEWITQGNHQITFKYLGKTCNQAPGCSVAFGVIFEGYDIKQEVGSKHSSVAGFNTQQGKGAEFLGNKWGVSYCDGRGIHTNDKVEVMVNMENHTLGFAVNGKDCGIHPAKLPEKVKFAVSTERSGDAVEFISYKKLPPVTKPPPVKKEAKEVTVKAEEKTRSIFQVGQTVYVQATSVNVRQTGQVEATKVGNLPIAREMQVKSISDEWLQIETSELTGWVKQPFVTETKPTLPSILARYRAAPPCQKVEFGVDCRDKLKEERLWLERAVALEAKNLEVMELLLKTLSHEYQITQDPTETQNISYQIEQISNRIGSLLPVYFQADSFNDEFVHDVVGSRLSCRQAILENNLQNAENPNDIDQFWSRTLDSKEVWPQLEKYCYEFSSDRSLWSFVEDRKTATGSWQKLPITFDMKLKTYLREDCTEALIPPPQGEITFFIKREDDGPPPLLLQSALVTPSTEQIYIKRLQLGAFSPVPETFPVVRKDLGPDKFQIHRSSMYGENPELGIKEIYAEAEIGKVYNGEGVSEEERIAVIRLVVEWASGDTETLFEDTGRAKYSYHPPGFPEKVILTDVNHDGSVDFLLDFTLHETKDNKLFREHVITYDVVFPIGGC